MVLEKRYREGELELLAGYAILMKQTSPSVEWLQGARRDLVKAYGALNEPEKATKFQAELAANQPRKADAPGGK